MVCTHENWHIERRENMHVGDVIYHGYVNVCDDCEEEFIDEKMEEEVK